MREDGRAAVRLMSYNSQSCSADKKIPFLLPGQGRRNSAGGSREQPCSGSAAASDHTHTHTRHMFKHANTMAQINSLACKPWIRQAITKNADEGYFYSANHKQALDHFKLLGYIIGAFPAYLESFYLWLSSCLVQAFSGYAHTHAHTHLGSQWKCRFIPSRMCWPVPVPVPVPRLNRSGICSFVSLVLLRVVIFLFWFCSYSFVNVHIIIISLGWIS